MVGVVDSEAARSLEASVELGAEKEFGDLRELIEHPAVDVVHICTPNYLHYQLAESVLALGKHVVCEKPLATSAKDADELARGATTVGVVAAVPFTYRYHAMVQEARRGS